MFKYVCHAWDQGNFRISRFISSVKGRNVITDFKRGGFKLATIRLIEENEASAEVKVIYDEIKQHFGLDFVPNAFKAGAHDPESLKALWEGLKQDEEYWGKEVSYLIGLAVDVTNQCSYWIDFDTAMLKQLGYDDAKIERLIKAISSASFYNKYVDGLRLESDVTPATFERKMAA